jgi:hypothetical protein
MAIQQPRRWRRGEGEGEEEREREREKRERKRSADSLSSAIETPTEQPDFARADAQRPTTYSNSNIPTPSSVPRSRRPLGGALSSGGRCTFQKTKNTN